MDVFKTAQKVNIHLGYLCKKICHEQLSKIVQSGHNAYDVRAISQAGESLSMKKSVWMCERERGVRERHRE